MGASKWAEDPIAPTPIFWRNEMPEDELEAYQDLAQTVALWKRTVKDGDIEAAMAISDKIDTKLVALGYDIGI